MLNITNLRTLIAQVLQHYYMFFFKYIMMINITVIESYNNSRLSHLLIKKITLLTLVSMDSVKICLQPML